MASKKSNTSRLFQLALNDVIKSNAEKMERNSQWFSTKEMIPQTVELKHGIASKQKSFLDQQHGSTSSLPRSKDLNQSCQETSQPPTDGTGDFHPVSLSMNNSDYSSTCRNPISVQDCSNSIYALPISLCEQDNSGSKTESHNPKWINPPSYNLSTFCNGEELSDLYGDQSGYDLLIGKTCNDHLSNESRNIKWPVTNELCSIGPTIPAPKKADNFFNYSSYTDQVNALNCKVDISNKKSHSILSDSFLLGDQNDQTAIPSPKRCDSLPSSFTDVVCSTNRKVLLPGPKGYDCLSNSATFSNHEYSSNSKNCTPAGIVACSTNRTNVLQCPKGCDCISNSMTYCNQFIPSPKGQNFFNSFPFSDENCLSNSEMTIPSPKIHNSFASSVPLTEKVCSANCDMIVSAKRFGNCSGELNSDFYQNQMSTCRSNCSSLKYDWRSQYLEENIPKSCSFKNCNCNLPSCNIYTSGSKPSENFCQRLLNLGDSKNELKKNIACDNLFPNDYLEELIRMGSKDSDTSRSENYLEDTPKTDSKLHNINNSPTRSVNERNFEKPSHTFDLKNESQCLIPASYISFEDPSLVDFKETSTCRKSAVKLTDSSMCNLDDRMNQSSVSITVPHFQSISKPKIKLDFYKSESQLKRTVPHFLKNSDLLRADNLTASESKHTDCIEGDSVKATHSILRSFDLADEFSTSSFTTSLDSLVDSNFENGTGVIVNITDCMSLDSCASNSTNSINEWMASEQDCDSYASEQNCDSNASSVFCNESRTKKLLEYNRSLESSVSKNIFSRPSTSIDSGIGFLLEDTLCDASLDRSSTCSEPESNVSSFNPKEKSSKLMYLDKNMINAGCKAKYAATSTEFSKYEFDRSDLLVDDQQRIDNLIDQFLGM